MQLVPNGEDPGAWLAVPHPGHDETLSSWNPFVSCDDNGGRDLNPAQAADSMCHSVLVMGVCSEGQVWQWQLPLLEGTIKGIKPPMPCSALLGNEACMSTGLDCTC